MTNSKALIYSEETREIAETNENIKSEIVLNSVINSLKGIFPAWRNAIKSQFELDNLKKEWLAAFIENKINTDTQINKALTIARKSTSPFIPSLGQFIQWCKTPEISSHSILNNKMDENKVHPKDVAKILEQKSPWYKSRNSDQYEQKH